MHSPAMVTDIGGMVALQATSEAVLEVVRLAEAGLLEKPQHELVTDHLLHRRVYCRTICVPKGAEMTGALIKIATTLIISGDAEVLMGNEWVRFTGYCVLPAAAGRKQAFKMLEDTHLTMIFATDAQTIEAIEAEFTDETALLGSRRDLNTIRITGE